MADSFQSFVDIFLIILGWQSAHITRHDFFPLLLQEDTVKEPEFKKKNVSFKKKADATNILLLWGTADLQTYYPR